MNVDYDAIASSFDGARSLPVNSIRAWLRFVEDALEESGGSTVLDLGCGTGRFALPIAREIGARVIGVDRSKGMLDVARGKDAASAVEWREGEAHDLRFRDESFDVVFISQVLHLVDGPKDVVRECWRVLRPRGVLLVRYTSKEEARTDLMRMLFAEAGRIDQARLPAVGEVEGWLEDSGFRNIGSIEVAQYTYESKRDWLRLIETKGTSTLMMISQRGFCRGLVRARQLVERQSDEPEWHTTRVMMTRGRR